MQKKFNIVLDTELTAKIKHSLQAIIISESSNKKKSSQIAKELLGVSIINENIAQLGFWFPGLKGKESQVKLRLYTPLENINYNSFKKGESFDIPFQIDSIDLIAIDDFLVGAIKGLKIGNREQFGSFYYLIYTDEYGNEHHYRDPLTQSVPFGVYAPAEIYDMSSLLTNRKDKEYFKTHYKHINPDGSYRAKDIGTTLEIHTETATKEGSIASLTEIYKNIAEKININILNNKEDIYEGLLPQEKNFVCFDTIELTPEVPPIERETADQKFGEFFVPADDNEITEIKLKKPDISNWGYDTPIIATGSINPSILRTGRPDEFLEFIETLHLMPKKPIQISFDAVLGHADFQGAKLLQTFEKKTAETSNPKYINSLFFRGPNMYGRDINYENPMVRAILLEMYRRKIQFGFDCVRVDGGQDFVKKICSVTGFRIQDDEFINEMVNITGEFNGITRRLDMNVEDGRPWPNDMNWLYNATYIEHLMERTLPFDDTVKQWGSLIFAHNVHGKYKWFQSKWDRFKDTFKEGENWITGHSNHDNARYFYRLVKMIPGAEYKEGTSVDEYYNSDLGDLMPEIAHNALDNGALSASVLAILPGSPMFFLNALFHTPWMFFRNTDSKYGVKVVADEGSRFLNWYIDEELFNKPESFKRIKSFGFNSLSMLITNPKKTEAFMDILFDLHEKIKTDPIMVLSLYDSKLGQGIYENVEELKERVAKVISNKEYMIYLNNKIDADKPESNRKIEFSLLMLQKALAELEKESLLNKTDLQIEKVKYLLSLDRELFRIVLEDSASQDEYSPEKWGKEKALLDVTPEQMKTKGLLTEQTLKDFTEAFMLDVKDISNIENYLTSLDSAKSEYNFKLRQFRQQNEWLCKNPTNNIKADFFNRKIITNGAKDLGAFFSDKGDTLNANTIYYGWRTSPDNKKKIFVITNMEGKPLAQLPLNQFIPIEGKWKVSVKSPKLSNMPDIIDRSYVIENFENGEALILEMVL